jgi:radical SAM-linked protein
MSRTNLMKNQRYRIEFSKTEAMRFTGHLDLILTWERTFRRAGLPLAYSEGFNPRPVINLASPLPLGFTSSAELGDFWLSENVPLQELQAALSSALPPGLILNEIREIPEVFGSKLPGLVNSSTYIGQLDFYDPGLAKKIEMFLDSTEFRRTNKRGKEYDLRPLVLDLKILEDDPPNQLIEIKLVTQPNQTGRPDEVLLALEVPPSRAKITRTRINLQSGASS